MLRRGSVKLPLAAAFLFALTLTALPVAIFLTHTERDSGNGQWQFAWGKQGTAPGQLQKPRAMAIDSQDHLYIVDMTARIQVFTTDGRYLHGWQTPESQNGRPSGLSIDGRGRVLVADTHYFQMLVYTPDGELIEDAQIGGVCGQGPGEFGFVTDAVEDTCGNYYVAEYGEYDRIQKFDANGDYLFQWGGHGSAPGQFIRPQNIAIDEHDHIWVADACNHRIQVFDATGESAALLQCWGEEGTEPGQLRYPYDLVLDGNGHVYVCEFGNHRIQKFSLDGKLVSFWGHEGREPGQLHNPWALVRDSHGRIFILDTYNHRVQCVTL
ncbi:MAG: NHL repeat-containing protein [Pirellulaceae bacterium]